MKLTKIVRKGNTNSSCLHCALFDPRTIYGLLVMEVKTRSFSCAGVM